MTIIQTNLRIDAAHHTNCTTIISDEEVGDVSGIR